jgi:hypothetical protein
MIGIRLTLAWISLAVAAPRLAAQQGEQLEFALGKGLGNYLLLTPFGRDWAKAAWADGRGLRVRLPVPGGNRLPVGIESRFQLRGDFEVTAAYELVAIGKPAGEESAGVMLLLQLDTPTLWQISLSRLKTAAGDVFKAEFLHGPDADRVTSGWPPIPARAGWGRLRLARSGNKLQLAVADGSTLFQDVGEEDIVRENVKVLRYVATNSGSQVLLDVRLSHLSIQSREVANQSALLSPPPRISWLAYLLGLGAGMLVMASGLWFWRARKRRSGDAHVPSRSGVPGGGQDPHQRRTSRDGKTIPR